MVRSLKRALVGLLFSSLAIPAYAADLLSCFKGAAEFHGVNASILMAIAITETGNCSSVVTGNKNGSRDYGCMGLNNVHAPELQKYGISMSDLLDSCRNIYVAAWYLRKKIEKFGNNWIAIGAYHSETPALRDAYSLRVHHNWIRYGLNIGSY